jgi:predicted AAA+ superfamily ATPase
MLERYALSLVEENLRHFPAVGLLGARQIGKTTLAQQIAARQPSLYLDLENYQDLAKLEDPVSYLDFHRDKLVILDEIQRKPEIFMSLRGLIDKNRRLGHRNGQFLILGSASSELLKQSSESLAGRIIYVEMAPLTAREIPETREDFYRLWLRGGFPDSFLSSSLELSMAWRQSFIKTYLERDIPQFGPRIPSESLRRLWTMLAHFQGNPLNASMLGQSLGLSGQTISRYIDLLSDLFLIRRLCPWHGNLSKRLIKSPKVYVRDSGILHALLNISSQEDLMSHPILGASWEGFVIDNLLSFLPQGSQACFYRTARGAEIDLVLSLPDRRLLAIEIKRSSAPKMQRGFYEACQDIKPTHCFVVYDGNEKFPLKENTIALSLKDMIKEIS